METLNAAAYEPEEPDNSSSDTLVVPDMDWPELTLMDRCVGRTATGYNRASTTCNAQAFVRYAKSDVTVDGESKSADLVFCGHCHAIHGMDLELQGFQVVQNDLYKINVTPSVSANAV